MRKVHRGQDAKDPVGISVRGTRSVTTPAWGTPAGRGTCPLVMGECVQGRLDGVHFHITAPVSRHSVATYFLDPATAIVPGHRTHSGLVVAPPECSKAKRAVEAYLDAEGLPVTGFLSISRPLPAGHGFGTSTADIVASLRAVSSAWGRSLSSESLARSSASIEPSDGSMFAGAVAFAHRQGVVLERLGPLPRLYGLTLLDGNPVATEQYDSERADIVYRATDEWTLRRAWAAVRTGIHRSDATLVAAASTVSARLNQTLLPRPRFREVERIARSHSACGILVGHSGSAITVLLDPRRTEFPRQRSLLRRELASLGAEMLELDTAPVPTPTAISASYPTPSAREP